MAGTDWQTRDPVVTSLLADGKQFSFYEAIRLLHGSHKDAPRIGHQGPPERERIRIRPLLSLVFPTADIAKVAVKEMPDGAERYQFDVAFMGLYGSSTPMPVFYTEDLLALENEESLLRGFLDIFHHRVFSLLFRVWEKYRHTVAYETKGGDFLSSRLLTMLGASLENQPGAMNLRPGRLLAYAGLLTQQPRSASALKALLADHFEEAPVEIEQCKGRWCEVAEAEQNRLGARNCTLGADLTMGSAVYDLAGNFGVNMGPLDFDTYMQFMPGSANLDQARELLDLFNNDCLDYEVTVTLKGEQVRRARLENTAGTAESAPYTRLGWSSWLADSSEQDRSVTFKFKGWKHGRG